jgi:acyl-coenzyme A thioesterase PaaI-like protein
VDLTALARRLLEPIPAHRSTGLRVLRAADGEAEVSLEPSPHLGNVIGTLHSSGLIALVDAVGLAAVIAAAPDEQALDGVLPLGAAAELRFHAPARGRLLARCVLDKASSATIRTFYDRLVPKIRVRTPCEVSDDAGAVVCSGAFEWSVRRVVEDPAQAAG